MKQKLIFKPLPGRDKLIDGERYWVAYDINDSKLPYFSESVWKSEQGIFWFGDNAGVYYDGVYGYLDWYEIEIEVVDWSEKDELQQETFETQ